ncbi:unnamed protein product [Trichobilharzia szidati]|nr:unnamed protein product [Trichobilharzia szidati]
MADYLKSAFNYFATSNTNKNENEILGSSISVGQLNLKVKRVIAEGGYGIVYEAQDVNENTLYALKRMLAHDKASADLIIHEVRLLKQLSGHPNILKFFSAASVGREKVKGVGTEFLILTEFCKGGQLNEYLPAPRSDTPLSTNVILQIFHQCCRAVQHMHSQCPPVIHRDLKIENLLLTDNFIIKLCDFGSATTITYNPDQSWTALKRGSVQEELERFTTPMYRAPEMLDLYQNYPIGTGADIWALGCILFYLTCTYHPFEDSSKLAILNANYTIPSSTNPENTAFFSLIRQLLLINPSQRPNINEVLGELSELASMREVRVSGSIPLLEEIAKRRNLNAPTPTNPSVNRSESKTNECRPGPIHSDGTTIANQRANLQPPSKPSRPNPPPPIVISQQQGANPTVTFNATSATKTQTPTVTQSSSNSQSQNQSVSNMFGMIKGGAGNLIRNIRDASTKVIGSVSTSLNTELDFQFITSRIAVTSFPIESGFEVLANVNSMEEMQNMLDTRFPDAYAVYNLSTRAYRSDHWFHGRVSHRGFESHRAPSLKSLIELCLNARLWLTQKPNNICVIHCTDGKTLSAMLACSLLCFCRVFDNASPAIQLFASRRGNPGLNASQIRYIDYVAQLSHNRVFTPHHFPLNLISLTIAPVPTFNRSKNGCRPYVEIFEGKTMVCSTYTDYDNLRPYVLEDGKIEILLNGLTVLGDLTVIIYHCRSSFAGSGKIRSVKIAQFQLYTGFVEHNLTELIYFKSDLDHLDNSSSFAGFTSRYAESFHVTLEFMVSPTERPRQSDNLVYPWETLPSEDALRPELCVSTSQELTSILSDFGRFNRKPSVSTQRKDNLEQNQSNSQQEKVNPEKSMPAYQPTADNSSNIQQEATADDDLLVPDLIKDNQVKPTDPSTSPNHSHKPSVHNNNNVQFFKDESSDNTTSLLSEDRPNFESDFVDLLGLHTESSVPSNVDSVGDPVLIDVTQNPFVTNNENAGDSVGTPKNQNGINERKTDKQLFVDDLFTFSPTVDDNPNIDLVWEEALRKPSENPSTTHSGSGGAAASGSSNNPFDPFGIATSELESDFFSTSSFHNPSTQSKSNSTNDCFEQTTSHLSGSASASNLNPPNINPLFSSTSYSNLAPNTETSDNTAAGATGSRHSLDPFADFADVLRNGLNNRNPPAATATSSSANAKQPPTTMGGFSAGPSPVHHPRSGIDPKFTNSSTKSDANQKDNTTNTGYTHEKSSQAHTSWSGFTNTSTSSFPSAGTGARPQVNKDAFSDLLGGFGSSRTTNADDKQPKTVNQIRREKMAKTTDPEQLKWMGTSYENMARLVFVELNDAMAEFEKDANNNSSTNMNL